MTRDETIARVRAALAARADGIIDRADERERVAVIVAEALAVDDG